MLSKRRAEEFTLDIFSLWAELLTAAAAAMAVAALTEPTPSNDDEPISFSLCIQQHYHQRGLIDFIGGNIN